MIEKLTIDRAEAERRLRQAYAAGKLVAQTPVAVSGAYYVRQGAREYRCAIGVLYPTEAARRLEDEEVVVTAARPDGIVETCSYPMAPQLMTAGLLGVPDEDRDWFEAVQTAHDQLCGARESLEFTRETYASDDVTLRVVAETRERFEELIGWKERK